jgi:hypothetical protein
MIISVKQVYKQSSTGFIFEFDEVILSVGNSKFMLENKTKKWELNEFLDKVNYPDCRIKLVKQIETLLKW